MMITWPVSPAWHGLLDTGEEEVLGEGRGLGAATFLVVLAGLWASLVVQMVKNLPAMGETWVQSLSQGDPLEKGMAIHSSILAWRIPWTEEPGWLQSTG